MARTVGVRELKARLSAWLRAVEGGAAFVVTDRGRPVAELRPVGPGAKGGEEALRDMEALGEVTRRRRRLRTLAPAKVRGCPVADTLLEDRGDRA